MSLSVPFSIDHDFVVKASVAEVFAVLADVPLSVSHFPDVAQLVDMGGDVYRWEMKKLGTASLNLQTIYASHYVSDKARGTVKWSAIEDVGNASVEGFWKLTRQKLSTRIVLHINGELHTPVPKLMRAVVSPIVRSEFERQIRHYVANLTRTFGGSA